MNMEHLPAKELENRLDALITSQRMKYEEMEKQPIKKKLRIFISHQYHVPPESLSSSRTSEWELRVEGRLVEECNANVPPSHLSTLTNLISNKSNKKFSDFFTNMRIELDKNLYGPKESTIEWKRDPQKATDGCFIKRPGSFDVPCTIELWIDYASKKYRLHPIVAKVLGIAYGTKTQILEAANLYVRSQKLQDLNDPEMINCDAHFTEIFNAKRMSMRELSIRIDPFLFQPHPVIFNHLIRYADSVKPVIACYDVEVELMDDSVKFLDSEYMKNLEKAIADEDAKLQEHIAAVNESQQTLAFYNCIVDDPVQSVLDIVKVQNKFRQTLKETFHDDPEKCETFLQPEIKEAVDRYIHNKIHQRRAELRMNIFAHSSIH